MEIQREADELALSKNVRFEQDVSESQLSAVDRKSTNDPDLDLLAALNEEIMNEDHEETDDVDVKLMAGKFVNLTDLLPPVPAKGNFKVEAIKGSQYFFS